MKLRVLFQALYFPFILKVTLQIFVFYDIIFYSLTGMSVKFGVPSLNYPK